MKNKIVVIGSSNVDLIMKMERLPRVGETITDAQFMQVFGGKGANTAVGAVRAGGNVSFVNCVGEDAYTPIMLKSFENDGIDCQFVFREKGVSSGHALVMIGSAGNNYLSVAPGANYLLTPEKIDLAMPLIKEASMILLQYEIPAETIIYVLNKASDLNIPVLWNFAPARAFDLSHLNKTSILIVNETEAGFLSGIEVVDNNSIGQAGRILYEKGVSTVIITLGEKGAYLTNKDFTKMIPAFKVEAVDTTAAGDIFCGTLAVGLVEGKGWEDALKFASAASAISVTRMGAQTSAPKRNEIDNFLSLHK